MLQDADALPQLIGDYKPVDQWQVHINTLFYRFRGDQIRSFYQTFASADYRLAHALAADYFEKVVKREKTSGVRRKASGENISHTPLTPHASPLTVMEWGPGNGNLAACFLSHLKVLDKDGVIYPRIRYVLVDWEQAVLDAALAHPELASHRARVETHRGTVDRLEGIADGSVDRIICNELWNDLPTKLMSRQANDIEEEFLRPNLSEALHAKISDWATFVRAFDAMDMEKLKGFPPFLDDLVWEREYRTVEWKEVPYRKTITDFLKRIDEQVLVPVNLGALCDSQGSQAPVGPRGNRVQQFRRGHGGYERAERSGKALLWSIWRATEFHGQLCIGRSGRQTVGGRHNDNGKPTRVRGAQFRDQRLDPHGSHRHPSFRRYANDTMGTGPLDAQDHPRTERDLSEPLCTHVGLPHFIGDATGGA